MGKYVIHHTAYSEGKLIKRCVEITNKLPAMFASDRSEIYKEIIDYLNEKLGTKFKWSSAANKRVMDARLNEGCSVDDFKRVIDNKVSSWGNDEKMSRYLRPETLFGTKFEAYLNEVQAKPKSKPDTISRKPTYDIEQIRKRAMENTTIKY